MRTNKKVFGLDKVNLQDNIFIVEGPIDSMFIDNCLASACRFDATCAT